MFSEAERDYRKTLAKTDKGTFPSPVPNITQDFNETNQVTYKNTKICDVVHVLVLRRST